MNRRTFLSSLASFVVASAYTALAQKDESKYTALGTGHYVQENREGGRFIVLEDKSVWEIHELNHHVTSQWQQYDAIAVRFQEKAEAPFQYGLTNEDKDEGATARWLRPQR